MEGVAKKRARVTLKNITGSEPEYLMHLGNYSTRSSGGSMEATLAEQFAKHHSLESKDSVLEFFDFQTGALVIIPRKSVSDSPKLSEKAFDE